MPRQAVWAALGAAPLPFVVAAVVAVVAEAGVAPVPRPMVSAAPGVLGLVEFVALWAAASAAVPARAAAPVPRLEAAQAVVGARQPPEGVAERAALQPASPVRQPS